MSIEVATRMNDSDILPPPVPFKDRFPPDEELTEAEQAAKHERSERAAAAYRALKAEGKERIVHRDPATIAKAIERRQQRIEALRAASLTHKHENVLMHESYRKKQ